MIDLHSHVLPGIDDGPGDLKGSLALCAAAVREGTTILAATPHLRADHPGVRPEELDQRCRDLSDELSAARIPLEIVSAAEVDLRWSSAASDEELALASFGQRGTDILIESPYAPLAATFDEMLSRLREKGYRILLAHPERNPTFRAEPRRLEELVANGVLLQVTASAVASEDRRSRSRWLAQGLVEHGLAHVIASDAHAAGGTRHPSLAAAVYAARILAPSRADWMVTDAPAAVLAGAPLPPPLDRPAVGLAGRRRRRRGH